MCGGMSHADVDTDWLADNSSAGNFIRKRRRRRFGSLNGSKQAAGNRAADDVHSADSAFERAFGGFQLKHHSAGNNFALQQIANFVARDTGQYPGTVKNSLNIGEINKI